MGGTKKLFHTLSLPLQQLAWTERFSGIETRKKSTPQARLLTLFYFREGGMRPTVRSKHRPGGHSPLNHPYAICSNALDIHLPKANPTRKFAWTRTRDFPSVAKSANTQRIPSADSAIREVNTC